MDVELRALRVLLIDDSPITLQVMGTQLINLGYEVETANGGLEGVEMFFTHRYAYDTAFDVVITDLEMPDFDGLQVLGNIASGSPDTPVIILSSRSEMTTVRGALRTGAFDYVVKDEGVEPLHAAIQRALRLVEEMRQRFQAVTAPLAVLEARIKGGDTGELIAVADDCEVHAFLLAGRIAWATSSKLKFAFTRHLVEDHGIDMADIRRVIEQCRRKVANVGEMLIEAGVATRAQVHDSLRKQITNALDSLRGMVSARAVFLARDAQYSPDLTFDPSEVLGGS